MIKKITIKDDGKTYRIVWRNGSILRINKAVWAKIYWLSLLVTCKPCHTEIVLHPDN